VVYVSILARNTDLLQWLEHFATFSVSLEIKPQSVESSKLNKVLRTMAAGAANKNDFLSLG